MPTARSVFRTGLALVLAALSSEALLAAAPQPVSVRAARFGVSRPVSELAREPINVLRATEDKNGVSLFNREINPTNTKVIKKIVPGAGAGASPLFLDPTVPAAKVSSLVRVIPAPSLTFDGVNSTTGILPPDTVGDVGPNHYVQNTNSSTTAITAIGIYDKNTGALLVPIFSMATLFKQHRRAVRGRR